MVILYQSLTLPINPPNTTPTLTLAGMWEVMHLKCRKPELFVKPMSSSEVIEETSTFMKRSVVFKEGMGPPGGKITEEMQIRAPWKVPSFFTPIHRRSVRVNGVMLIQKRAQVDFHNLDTGAFVNNTLSQGKDDKDLYLTFYFEWPYPDLKEGSEEAEDTNKQLWLMARTTVQHTIDLARDMAREGKLRKGVEH